MEWSEFSFVLKPSSIGGVGVFATHNINAGTLLFPAENFIVRTFKIEDVPAAFVKYCIYINEEECIVPQRFDRMEIGWYINHSSKPNISLQYVLENGVQKKRFYAIKDIKEGDEILMDYNELGEPESLKEDYYRHDNHDRDHKIIYMITLARSTSTAFLRMMHARDDFTVLHEPSGCAYNVIAAPHIVDQVFRADAPRTFAAVHEWINDVAAQGNVFVKEMRPVAEAFLEACPEFLTDPRVQFVFLVRNPHDMLISNYMVRKNAPPLAPEIVRERLSYASLHQLFEKVSAVAVNPPLIILSEDFCAHPTEVVQGFCKQIGVPFLSDMLSWESREGTFDVREWNGITNGKNANNWHGEAIKSTGIYTARKYVRDSDGKPTFEEIDSEEWRQFYRALYEESLPYYQLLLENACTCS